MKILTVVGARPQFIKSAVVSRVIAQTYGIEEIILHTGQHFDSNMSDIFFSELSIPRPSVQLNVNSSSHGEMTGRMLMQIEAAVLAQKPDRVLVYGDTNSTLAGALAAAKLHIPVAHVEAGLRSFNMRMPEEVNRILTDNVSDLLFCPTQLAVKNLEKEGFGAKPVQIAQVGDVMQDAAILFARSSRRPTQEMPSQFIVATLHRAENTDDPGRLGEIVGALNELHELIPVVLPLHPRTRMKITQLGLDLRVQLLEPVGYLEMIWLLANCQLVVTDSGGVQKEAFFFGKYCVTMRDQTEWVELLECGANVLTGASRGRITEEVKKNLNRNVEDPQQLYGGGAAAEKIVKLLLD